MLLLLSAASASLHEQHPLVPAGTAPQPSWDREPNVRCDHPVTDVVSDAPNADACAKACTSRPSCVAAVHNGTCILHDQCTILRPAGGSVALFRPSQMVPAGGPAAVQWQHSVVMVICSFQKPMDWLQSQEMAPMLANVDLAVYAKGNKTFDDVSALSKNLRFFKRVPNFGLSGGSREPYIYFDFLLDFYENLPSSAVLFSQDDESEWLRLLNADALRTPDASFAEMNQGSCECDFMHEDFFAPDVYFWWSWVTWYDEAFLGWKHAATKERPESIEWPQRAAFAVSTSRIRRRSTAFYEKSRSLTRVEGLHAGLPTLSWSNAFERLWFHIFDAQNNLNETAAVKADAFDWGSNAPTPSFTAAQRAHRDAVLLGLSPAEVRRRVDAALRAQSDHK